MHYLTKPHKFINSINKLKAGICWDMVVYSTASGHPSVRCTHTVTCLASPDATKECAVCNDEQPKKPYRQTTFLLFKISSFTTFIFLLIILSFFIKIISY